MTYRRFAVLLAGLPRESRFVQERYGERVRWGTTEHLLANVVDIAAMLNHNFVQSKSRKKSRPPKPMQRPGDPPPTAAGTKKLTGKAVPLARLKQLAAKWRGVDPGGDDGGS